MIELTPEQRKKIYREERMKMGMDHVGAFGVLTLATVAAGMLLATLVRLGKSDVQPRIEDLRKAFEGIDTDDEEYE